MNSALNGSKKFTAMIVALLLLASSLSFAQGTAQGPEALSKKELKELVANAKTSTDHQKLSTYYQDKAQRLRAKSQEFFAQADKMKGQPSLESKQGISCNCEAHYRYFANLYAQQAKDAEVLAAKQDTLIHNYNAQAQK